MSSRRIRCAGLLTAAAVGLALVAEGSAQTIIIDRPINLPPAPPDRPPPDHRPPLRPPQRGIKMEVRNLSIEAAIVDGAAVTKVDQTFHNPHDFAVEGTYIFPLDDDVAVSRFTMDVNGREIEGRLLDVREARAEYESIVRSMRDPALLEYVGRKMFKASIFPINPHSDVRVRLSYAEMVDSRDGIFQYRYPLNTEKYLPSPIGTLSMVVRLESKAPIKSAFSPTHEVAVSRLSDNRMTASMEVSHQFPDRDFDFFYTLSDREFGLTVLTYRQPGEDGFFLARISPNATVRPQDVLPKDIAFVLDTSGSMNEEGKIGQARAALKFCLSKLHERDAFGIITFAHEPRRFTEKLVPATAENRQQATGFVDKLEAVGGTNINDALLSALKDAPQADPGRPFYIVFLTDGQPTVGECRVDDILKNVREHNTQRTRLFVFGVGHDVNTKLLDLLAEQNRGTREYVEPGENLELALSSFYHKISDPVLSDLALAFGGLEVHDMYPPKLGDLFGGMELVVVGRYSGSGHRAVELTGTRRGAQEKHVYETRFPDDDRTHEFLPRLWASRKVGYLLDEIRLHGENPELKNSVVALAKKYGIITPYTSYLVTEPQRLARGRAFDYGRPRAELDTALNALGYAEDVDPALGVFLAQTDPQAEDLEAAREDLPARSAKAGLPPPRVSAPAEPATTGRVAVGQSKEAKELQDKEIATGPARSAPSPRGRKPGDPADLVRTVGARTFYKSSDKWIDSAYDGKAETRKVTLFADEYFDLLGKHKELAKCFALGDRVIVVVDATAYETVPADDDKPQAEPETDKPADDAEPDKPRPKRDKDKKD